MNNTVRNALLFVGLAAIAWALLVLTWRLARWAIILAAWIIVFAVASAVLLWALLVKWSPPAWAWLQSKMSQAVRSLKPLQEGDAA